MLYLERSRIEDQTALTAPDAVAQERPAPLDVQSVLPDAHFKLVNRNADQNRRNATPDLSYFRLHVCGN